MSMLVWIMMGIAIWHYAVYVPDKFWGGIVGAFAAAVTGAVVFSFIVNGLKVPGADDMGLEQAFISIPGSVLGLVVAYFVGDRAEKQAAEQS